MMKLKGTVRMARPHYSDGSEFMNISIYDESSSLQFLDIEMSYPEFVKALTSSDGECTFEARGLDKIGKTHQHKTLEFHFPHGKYDMKAKELAAKEVENHVPEGWVADKHFNSQNSFFTKDGKDYARTTIRRWV